MTMILLTGFSYKDNRPKKYATLGSYIYNLVNTSEIQINFFKAPKVSEYFGDIKDSNYYAGAFINAAVSGILKFPQKRVAPWKWIKVSDAKQLMDRAYMYKTNQKILISNVVFSELVQMDKYKKVNNNHYLTSQMEKDIFDIYSKKIAEYNKGNVEQSDPEDKINLSKKIENEYLLITLDWGEKPTLGYGLEIAGAREVGDTIEVYYNTTAPKEGQMNAQVITYPKDKIRLKVSNINKAYNIITKKTDENLVRDVKYFTQVIDNSLKLTLSLGEKPTGGYSIKILEAKQIGEEIIVKYNIKTPAEGDIVTQAITYPSDSIDVKVKDINKRYSISLNGVNAVSANNDGIKTSTTRVGEYIEVTLDWGQKSTGGYIIKILEAKQVGSTIEVKYMTKSPGPSDFVTQALTYPKDSIKVKVDDPTKEYKVILIK
jgi:hypothetical protein